MPQSSPPRRRRRPPELELQRAEYAQLEDTIRSGLRQIEDNVGAAVARILGPFLDTQVVKRHRGRIVQGHRPALRGGLAGVDDYPRT